VAEDQTFFSADRAKVFDFFSNAENLAVLTPAFLNFKILSALPIQMGENSVIKYRLRLHGLPIFWRTLITVWDPPKKFVDEQLKGPFITWIHEHQFQDDGNGTLMLDKITYRPPFAAISNTLFVKPQIEAIFKFRKDKMLQMF